MSEITNTTDMDAFLRENQLDTKELLALASLGLWAKRYAIPMFEELVELSKNSMDPDAAYLKTCADQVLEQLPKVS